MTEIKNVTDGFKNRLDRAEERINALELRSGENYAEWSKERSKG